MAIQTRLSEPLEIVHDSGINSVAFSPDGTYIATGCNDGTVQKWRVHDGMKIGTTMHADGSVLIVTISCDGKWILSGGFGCKVTVWDTETQERVIESKQANEKWVSALDVSPCSKRFASASSDCTVNIWCITTGQRLVGPLDHNSRVECIAFSPNGDHVATAGNCDPLRIWDARDGRPFVDFPGFSPESIVWSGNDRIFASTWSTQRWVDACAGTVLLDLPRSGDTATKTHLAISRHGNSLVCLDKYSLRLWDRTTYTWHPTAHELGYNGCTVAVSSNCHRLVTGGGHRISIWNLPVSMPEDDSRQNGMFMHIPGVIEQLWLRGELESALGILSRHIALNRKSHHALANRALIEARLKRHGDALNSAKASIAIQPSAIGYISKSVALLHQDAYEDSMQGFDLAFGCCGTEQMSCLLIKAVILFLSGRHHHAIARIADLIESYPGMAPCHIVQAHISLIRAKCALGLHNYNTVIEILASTLDIGEFSPLPELLTISLITGWDFNSLRFEIHRTNCLALFALGRVSEATTSFLKIDLDAEMSSEGMKWITSFRRQCADKLVEEGEAAVGSAAYHDATTYYSLALMLEPSSTAILIKRSRVHQSTGNWEAALRDANEAIRLDSLEPSGHEEKYAALHGAGRYDEAVEAFRQIPSRLRESSNHHIQETTETILGSAKDIQHNLPFVLIDTKDGSLCNEEKRICTLKADKQLVSSMLSRTDNDSIFQAVQEYFQYATFSHTWGKPEDEPHYHHVLHNSVYGLEESLGNTKLQMFCKVVKKEFRWAWSDTCCIDKEDPHVLRASLTAMFRWYQNSSLTVVHLNGVSSDLKHKILEDCPWNTRAWTLQEFFASRVIRFFTEDWQLYLPNEGAFNHKESPVVMREMAHATGIDAQELLSLCPGSENVRQKLRLASTRSAKEPEDIAYSLFGIFKVSISVRYGEGKEHALGRLLAEVLKCSGDGTILDWTGRASDYNTCLPAEITAYRDSPHFPSTFSNDGMEIQLQRISQTLHDPPVALYDKITKLPSPCFSGHRLTLPCIVFPLEKLKVSRCARDTACARVYYGSAKALSKYIKITTSEELACKPDLILVHPWLQCLSDPALQHKDMIPGDTHSLTRPSTLDSSSSLVTISHKNPTNNSSSGSLHGSQPRPPLDKTTRALRLFARLRQPFGALLLVPQESGKYKRVATDNPIVASIRDDVAPDHLMKKICTLDIL